LGSRVNSRTGMVVPVTRCCMGSSCAGFGKGSARPYSSVGRKKKATRRSGLSLRRMRVCFGWLVAHDGFFGLRLGSGLDRGNHSLRRLLPENFLAVKLGHLGVLGVLFYPGVAGADFFFARVLGDTELLESVVRGCVHVLLVEGQLGLALLDADLLTTGEDLMASVLLVPLGEGRCHVHLLDDVAPSDAGVVGAEADFTFLRGIRDDALFGTAEVVVEQVLEPHAGDEQEVPTVSAALFDVGHSTVAGNFAVVAAGCAKALVELGEKVCDFEVLRRLARIVVAEQRKRNADNGEELAASGVVDLGNVL